MSISVKRKKVEKLKDAEQVQMFGVQQGVEEFDSKQFVVQNIVRINAMLKDALARSYEGKAGAELLLAHIKDAEGDKTYWTSSSPVTEPTGERKQKSNKHQVVTLEFLAPKDFSKSDFDGLAGEGKIDSKKVYFSQLRCGPNFQVPINIGDGKVCTTVAELTLALKGDANVTEKVTPIKIIWYQDKVTSVDNRRLKAHREAGVQVRYVKAAWDSLTLNEQNHFDPQAPAANINVT